MRPPLSSALLQTQSDERLLALARGGKERAFEMIVERYRKPLERYCSRFLPAADVEDAVQQVFLKAWAAVGAGAEVRAPKAWLYGIARNTVLDAVRKPGYDYSELEESLRSADGPEEVLERRAIMRKTIAGLAALPENQREALLRSVLGGQSRAEIADELAISEGAVRQLLFRARATMRAATTALMPVQLINWALSSGGASAPLAGGGTEVAIAGSGGLAATAKAAAVLVAVGAVAGGPVVIHALKAKGRLDVPGKGAQVSGSPRAGGRSRLGGEPRLAGLAALAAPGQARKGLRIDAGSSGPVGTSDVQGSSGEAGTHTNASGSGRQGSVGSAGAWGQSAGNSSRHSGVSSGTGGSGSSGAQGRSGNSGGLNRSIPHGHGAQGGAAGGRGQQGAPPTRLLPRR